MNAAAMAPGRFRRVRVSRMRYTWFRPAKAVRVPRRRSMEDETGGTPAPHAYVYSPCSSGIRIQSGPRSNTGSAQVCTSIAAQILASNVTR